MELRHLRYFVAVAEEQHYGRAAQRLNVAQPAISRQIQDLEEELGVQLFDRLPRGVRISAAGKQFMEDARRILQEVQEAAQRAGRVARGETGTLRVGFTENSAWRGIVPEALRLFRQQQPDAELQLKPMKSREQIEAIRAGRLDAGFLANLVTDTGEIGRDLDHIQVAVRHIALAVPTGHALEKLRKIRLHDLTDVPFVWFIRRDNPVLHDRLMRECYQGGLKHPLIVQEAWDEATILSLVLHGTGVGIVIDTARWRCPEGITVLPVADLNVPFPLSLTWGKDNRSPLLTRFIATVRPLIPRSRRKS
jgi:DNA-binding transcriptional LysR family regulator